MNNLITFSYPNAHLIQVKINELSFKDKDKFQEEKQMKLNREIEKLSTKHDIESQAFQTKMNSTYGEFKRDRALEFDKLMMRYRNKIKDSESQHKNEIYNAKKRGSSKSGTLMNTSKSKILGTNESLINSKSGK